MSRQPLHRSDIRAGVEQFGNKRPAEIVRRTGLDPGLLAPDLEPVHEGLGGYRAGLHGPCLVHGCQQRTFPIATGTVRENRLEPESKLS